MPANKNAVIRYKYLDEFLSDKYHYYDIHDLTDKCNERLECDGYLPICQRTVEKDLNFLEDAPFRAELERFMRNGKWIIRYKEPGFSIFTKKLSDDEVALLKEVLGTIGQFDGLNNFTWLDGLQSLLDVKQQLPIIDFSMPKIDNSNLLGKLFSAISAKQVIDLTYCQFGGVPKTFKVHPYLLKHYNGRWFLICATDSDNFVLTFALDRIDEFVADPVGRYKECPTDLRRRFDDIVGVTCYLDRPVEDVILWVSSDGFPYLLSKPLHPSQIVISDSESGYLRNKWRQLSGGSFVRMRCIVNPELEQAIMAYADELVVLSPQSLRESIRQKIFRLKSNYLL